MWFTETWVYLIWLGLVWCDVVCHDVISIRLVWFGSTWYELIWNDMIWFDLTNLLVCDTCLSYRLSVNLYACPPVCLSTPNYVQQRHRLANLSNQWRSILSAVSYWIDCWVDWWSSQTQEWLWYDGTRTHHCYQCTRHYILLLLSFYLPIPLNWHATYNPLFSSCRSVQFSSVFFAKEIDTRIVLFILHNHPTVRYSTVRYRTVSYCTVARVKRNPNRI